MSDKVSDDSSVDGDELDDVDEVESEVENEEHDEDGPRRRRGRRTRKRGSPEFKSKAFDPVAHFQRRLPGLVMSERFRAWLKQHYPAIRSRTELTLEIVNQYDEYDMAMVRQRALRPAAPADPEVAEFAATAFSYGDERGWPTAFREWAARQHGIHHREQVTRAIIDQWHEYMIAQHQAHHAKADFDYKELDPDEYQAGVNEWVREKHSYFDGFPNTRATWAALMQRRTTRIAREKEEAECKAAKEWAEDAERRRLEDRVEKLKAYKLPAITGPVPKLAAIGVAREEHDKAKMELLQTWRARFNELPDAVQTAWVAYHHLDSGEYVDVDAIYLTPRDGADVDDQNADKVVAGLRNPAFANFHTFNEGVRQAIRTLDDKLEHLLSPPADAFVPHRGYTLDEIADEDEHYVLANVIPEGLSVLYGAPKAGKSAWAQKLSVSVSDLIPFDGAEVAHGRVLYVTCDPGARKGAVKRRITEILGHLQVASNPKLVIVEDPVILNDPTSVASLLDQNPGQFALVVVDPLYQCVTGSLLQDAVMMEAIKGLGTIQRATGAAVLLIHHEPRGSEHLFGSMLLDAALDAQIHVERDENTVTVKVELLKNGEPPTRPLVYEFDGAYLAPIVGATRTKSAETEAKSAESRYAEMLTLLPDTPIRESEARKLIGHLLTGQTPAAKRQQWHRALKAMAKTGRVIRRGGMVQRQPRDERDT